MIAVSSEVACPGKCPQWPACKFSVPGTDFFRTENRGLLKRQTMASGEKVFRKNNLVKQHPGLMMKDRVFPL